MENVAGRRPWRPALRRCRGGVRLFFSAAAIVSGLLTRQPGLQAVETSEPARSSKALMAKAADGQFASRRRSLKSQWHGQETCRRIAFSLRAAFQITRVQL